MLVLIAYMQVCFPPPPLPSPSPPLLLFLTPLPLTRSHLFVPATTVSATMILAAKCGIRVFATGGIGGVHRGAEVTMDISADLKELSQTPVTVVCSGVKSILDIAKTLEVLEYQGVPVFGYQTDSFPAFFTNNSGCKSPLVANTSLEIARAMICQDDLNGLNGQGMLVGVPNPHPGDTLHIEEAIQQALASATGDGIYGNAVTPYVLARVKELTGGRSLEANISLVKNNAAVAADIAIEYAPLARAFQDEMKRKLPVSSSVSLASPPTDGSSPTSSNPTPPNTPPPPLSSQSVVVFGGAVVDQMMTPLPAQPLLLHTSNPGNISWSYGGVGRNIAEGLAQLGSYVPFLVTAIGSDANGVNLLSDCRSKGINTSFITQSTSSHMTTAVYSAVHDEAGDLVVAIAAMDIFQHILNSELLKRQTQLQNILRSSFCDMVVMDGNITVDLFSAVCALCSQYDLPIFFEPTSVPKCTLPILANCLHHVGPSLSLSLLVLIFLSLSSLSLSSISISSLCPLSVFSLSSLYPLSVPISLFRLIS
jgi:pseudouridylate synthase / pseudouridine kinase